MNKEEQILVAIDFSKCSIKALEFAILLTNNFGGNILMTYVDKPESAESIYSKRGMEHREKINSNFDSLVKKYKPSLKGKLEYKIRKGKIHVEIANQAKYSDAYLLIAGTHGVSGYEPLWIGSNAFKLVIMSPCPTLTLRENFIWKKKNIGKIVLPIDSTIETRQKVPLTIELAKKTGAEIHVLGLYSTKVKDIKALVTGYVKQAGEFIEQGGVKCEKQIQFCENITDRTINYAKEINAELIVIMTEQEITTKNIWLGPYAQQMVNHSPIPVLTVHSRNIYDVQGIKD